MRSFTVYIALFVSAVVAGTLQTPSHLQIARHVSRRVNPPLQLRATSKKAKKCRKVKNSTSSSSAKASTPTKSTGTQSGTVRIADPSYCGGTGASANPSKTTGPNGSEDFLNCGVKDSSGWKPPTITVDQVISKNLDDVIGNSVFSPCKQYQSFFNHWGGVYNIPPIMLASIALQESSCNAYPNGGDANGLMQISNDKCGGAPGGNCNDPYFNIGSGAQYLRSVIDSHGGNLVQSIGEYNGWNYGMTVDAAKKWIGGSCVTQRNLDYLHQFFNGWMQGVDASNMGEYFNLNNC